MVFTDQQVAEFKRTLSSQRFSTYRTACGNDDKAALALYNWNLEVSSAFFIPLQFAEVSTRNGVSEAIEQVFGANWANSKAFQRTIHSPRSTREYDPKSNLVRIAQKHDTNGKIIADLNFAFWEKILTRRHDATIWNRYFVTSFPNALDGQRVEVSRGHAHQSLKTIRKLRNRIAHHEPIFNRNLLDEFNLMIELIRWRSNEVASWVENVETVRACLDRKP